MDDHKRAAAELGQVGEELANVSRKLDAEEEAFRREVERTAEELAGLADELVRARASAACVQPAFATLRGELEDTEAGMRQELIEEQAMGAAPSTTAAVDGGGRCAPGWSCEEASDRAGAAPAEDSFIVRRKAGEAWWCEAISATKVYVGDEGPLLLDDGFRRVLTLLSGDHGVYLLYDTQRKTVQIDGMISAVHDTVVAILRTALDCDLDQNPAYEAVLGPAMDPSYLEIDDYDFWKERVLFFWASRGYVADLVISGDPACGARRRPRESTCLEDWDLILWGPRSEEVQSIQASTVSDQAIAEPDALKNKRVPPAPLEASSLDGCTAKIRASKTALRHIALSDAFKGLFGGAVAVTTNEFGSTGTLEDRRVSGWINWSRCLLRIHGPAAQVAQAHGVLLSVLEEWNDLEVCFAVSNKAWLQPDAPTLLAKVSNELGFPLVVDVEGGVGAAPKAVMIRGRVPTVGVAKTARGNAGLILRLLDEWNGAEVRVAVADGVRALQEEERSAALKHFSLSVGFPVELAVADRGSESAKETTIIQGRAGTPEMAEAAKRKILRMMSDPKLSIFDRQQTHKGSDNKLDPEPPASTNDGSKHKRSNDRAGTTARKAANPHLYL